MLRDFLPGDVCWKSVLFSWKNTKKSHTFNPGKRKRTQSGSTRKVKHGNVSEMMGQTAG